jgi:hypothetical protein
MHRRRTKGLPGPIALPIRLVRKPSPGQALLSLRPRPRPRRVFSSFLTLLLVIAAGPGLLRPGVGTAAEPVALTDRAPVAHTAVPPQPGPFVRLRPYFTRDPLVAARSPLDGGEHYRRSPLSATPRILGLGLSAAYPLTPWLELHSAYRLNLAVPAAQGGGTAARARAELSHGLFLGVSIPFSVPGP